MQRWETLFSNVMGGVCGNRTGKTKAVCFSVSHGSGDGMGAGMGYVGVGYWLLQGGRVWVSGTSSDVNVGPMCLSGPPSLPGRGLPAPFELLRLQFSTLVCPWRRGCSKEKGHME